MKKLCYIIAVALCCILTSCDKDDEPKTPSEKPDEPIVEMSSAAWETGEKELLAGYWSEKHQIKIETGSDWTLCAEGTMNVEVNDAGTWHLLEEECSGNGNSLLELRIPANGLFEQRTTELIITFEDGRDTLSLAQEASPDMISLIEDEMFRMAVSTSCSIYGIDQDEDMKVWTKVQLTDKNREVELIAKSLTNYLYGYGPIQAITRKYHIQEQDRKILDQYTANRIAGILMLYLAKDVNRINDIVNKYNIPEGIVKEITPELEGYIEK